MKWSARLTRHLCIYTAVAAFGVSALVTHSRAADGKDVDITDIMKKAFKGPGGGKKPGGGAPAAGAPKKPSLVQKAVDGTATPDEIKSLLGYCQELAKAKPPKGEQKDWDQRCSSMVSAVEAIGKGDKSAAAKLKTSSNCKECHNLHQDK